MSLLPQWIRSDVARGRALGRAFRKEVLEANNLLWDKRAAVDHTAVSAEVLNELNRRRFFSLWLPKFLGGGGLSPLSYLAMTEEVAEGCLGTANILGAHYVALALASATDDLKTLRFLTGRIRRGEIDGRPCVLATAITEPDAGSDLEDWDLLPAAKVQTKCTRTDTGFTLNGSKQFISNAPYASWFVVSAFEELAKPRYPAPCRAKPYS
ncbi:MAG: acyl-CoA dehydrogenase family protein, partial [Bdellovibrionia bacterium]